MDFLVFEIRKNLGLRKILVTPKIFLKSRVHCTNKNILFAGLIAVPINCMMSVTGNCSYKYDKNYVLPNYTCRLEKDNTTFVVQEKYASYHRSDFIYFHST